MSAGPVRPAYRKRWLPPFACYRSRYLTTAGSSSSPLEMSYTRPSRNNADALSGGRGSPVGSIFGAVILGLIGSVVFFAGVPFEYQNLVQGLIVLAALAGGVTVARR